MERLTQRDLWFLLGVLEGICSAISEQPEGAGGLIEVLLSAPRFPTRKLGQRIRRVGLEQGLYQK